MSIFQRRLARSGVVLATVGLAVAGAAGIASAAPAAPASDLFPCSFDGSSNYCTITLANLNERIDPTSNSTSEGVLSKGTEVVLYCWTAGQSVNGDDIWYQGQPTPPNEEIVGFFMAGYYLDTGHDPASVYPQC